MRHAGPLLWIGKGRERRILELNDGHMREVVNTVSGMNRAILAFCELDSDGVEAGFQYAFKSEREADRIKKEILEELSKGIFHPITRDELVRVVMTSEEVAANAKAAARKLRLIKPKKVRKELREIMKKFSEYLVQIAGKLYETSAALTKEPKSAVALSHEVEKLEEKIDDLRSEELLPELISWHKTINNTGISILMEKIFDNMENVADFCEDVCDVIRCIAISR